MWSPASKTIVQMRIIRKSFSFAFLSFSASLKKGVRIEPLEIQGFRA